MPIGLDSYRLAFKGTALVFDTIRYDKLAGDSEPIELIEWTYPPPRLLFRLFCLDHFGLPALLWRGLDFPGSTPTARGPRPTAM
jgi:hypothetical protein